MVAAFAAGSATATRSRARLAASSSCSARSSRRDRECLMSEPSLPLRGLTVAEFSHAIMGPSAGMVLADLGADVIKVEPAPDGDPTRRLKGSGVGFFGFYNRNKKSLALDLKSPAARPVVEALIKQSDVLIENFAVGTMDRLGLGYEAVSTMN